ncbi:MAG: hypothetical protein IJ723_00145 [Ruminococcus sp.]|nr:hypothetical protein [Ruminococcus sp.]
MKKTIATILALAIALSAFASCGSSTADSSEKETTAATTATTTAEETTTTEAVEAETTTEKTTTAAETTTTEKAETMPLTEITEESKETEPTEPIEPETPDADIVITSANDYALYIEQQVPITDITWKAAELIGAADGVGFKLGEKKYEIYDFSNDPAKLEEASTGSLTLTLEGFGDYTSVALVNDKYVLLYHEEDKEDVIEQAFLSAKF